MGPVTLFVLILITIVALAVTSGLLVSGGKRKREYGKVLAGWIVLGVLFTGLTALLLFLIFIYRSAVLVILLVFSPLIIILGLIICLSLGITRLVEGFSKDLDGKRNPSKITTGFVLLGIATLIILMVVVLIILFETSVIHISLMQL